MSEPEKNQETVDQNTGTATDASAPQESTPGTDNRDELAGVLAKLEAVRSEAEANRDQFLRTLAEFDNYRRRVQRDKDEARQTAVGRLLEDFVPVYDTLALALQTLGTATDAGSVSRGVEMLQTRFLAALEKNGVVQINPAAGAAFDPNLHESIAAQPHPTAAEGTVAQLVRSGFQMSGRVLRPATVILSSGAPANT